MSRGDRNALMSELMPADGLDLEMITSVVEPWGKTLKLVD